MNFGRFYPADSFWHQRDPRVKLMIFLLVVAFVLIEKNIVGQLTAFIICGVFFYTAKIPLSVPLKALYAFRWLLGLTFFANILFTQGGKRLPGLNLTISLIYLGRLITLILLGVWLVGTTESLTLIKGLERSLSPFKRFAPVDEMAVVLGLSLHFFPLLMEESEEIIMAQRARGVTFQGKPWRKIRGLISMVAPLFFSALRRSSELALAMEARGFTPGAERSSYHELAWKREDTFVLSSLVCLLIFWLSLRKVWV